ncbi:MAG: CrcB family protein [Bacteroidales bacterium]
MKELLFVFIGGGAGSAARYGLSLLFAKKGEIFTFPWHTFLSNTLGCLIIGVAMGMLAKQPGHWLLFLIVTGFCGGFTTFSTFSLELMHFFRQGNFILGGIYLFSSLLICIICTTAGFVLAK